MKECTRIKEIKNKIDKMALKYSLPTKPPKETYKSVIVDLGGVEKEIICYGLARDVWFFYSPFNGTTVIYRENGEVLVPGTTNSIIIPIMKKGEYKQIDVNPVNPKDRKKIREILEQLSPDKKIRFWEDPSERHTRSR